MLDGPTDAATLSGRMGCVRTLTSALVSISELADLLAGEDPPVVLDVRWALGGPPGRQEYEARHIPGALFVDLDGELSGEPGAGGRHPLPEPDSLRTALRKAGVRTDHPVVVYDAADGSVAARAWWLLRWARHEQVAVLDGGFAAWVAGDRPVSREIPAPAAGDVEVVPGGMPVLDAMGAARFARAAVLLDARAPHRYRGDEEPVDPRAGHIPGAVNAPFADHSGPDGRWRSAGELAEHFAGLGVLPGEPVAAYCGSGVTAASVVLALEVAGVTTSRQAAALYAGSWSHWCTDEGRPVATGPEPC